MIPVVHQNGQVGLWGHPQDVSQSMSWDWEVSQSHHSLLSQVQPHDNHDWPRSWFGGAMNTKFQGSHEEEALVVLSLALLHVSISHWFWPFGDSHWSTHSWSLSGFSQTSHRGRERERERERERKVLNQINGGSISMIVNNWSVLY